MSSLFNSEDASRTLQASVPTLHPLLLKQIARCSRGDGSVDLAALNALVSSAYDEQDKDRRRTERSIALMVEELDEHSRKLEAQVAKRTLDLENATQRLESTLTNVDQGIVMVDATGRIVVFNSTYVELSGLTPADFAGNPLFCDIVDKMHSIGEFDAMGDDFKAWVRLSGRHAGKHSFQRTRPDGTVLQIQTCPLPDGGEVRTIADITQHVRRSEEISSVRTMLEATLENVSQGIMKIDAQRRIPFFNTRASELLGLPAGFLEKGQTLQSLLEFQIDSGEFANMSKEFIAFVRSGGVIPTAQVYERQRPNGTILEIRTAILPDGSAVRTFTDITTIRQREKALEDAQQEYRSLFENSTVGIYRSSPDGQILRANPALFKMHGYESEEDMVRNVKDISEELYVDPRRRAEFLSIIQREDRITDFVSEMHRGKGREKFWVSEAVWTIRDAAGNPTHFEGMMVDASDRKRAENEIAHIALHDMLTNLPNRTLFLDTLKSALTDNRKGQEIAVLCLDLDHFKDVNDTMGHDCGDILLRMASRRITRALPPGGMAARFGGDEFAVILPDIRDRDSVLQLAREIVRALSNPFRVRGKRVYVGVSIGITLSPTDGNDAHELLKKADIALYRAKRDGRGTYACFDAGMTAAILARREVEVDLRKAIANEEFRVFYQPIVDLETSKAVSYEALVRWEHPQKGLLSPFFFIEIAEECGLILQIGELVLRDACTTIAKLDHETCVSVNLSPVQFRNHQLALSVVNALSDSGLSPHRLVLEITESVLLTDDSHTLDILRQLRTLGVRIALDDFGIGHSSLSYLQKFPFDKIKIDKSFVQDTDDGTMNTAIRRAMLGLGQDLGVEVIVEGVETELQRDMLIYEGCRYIQGYLYGKPQPESTAFTSPLVAIAA